GASIVDEADRTNSPRSPNLARTTLLSTPNSLASSYTRTFATALLLGPGCRAPDRPRLFACSSLRAHRALTNVTSCLLLPYQSPDARAIAAAHRYRSAPRAATPAETPDGARLGRDTPGRSAGTHPGRGAGREGRALRTGSRVTR